MDFHGAEEYYFWQGIKEGSPNRRHIDLNERLGTLVAIDGNMAEKCREAFRSGYEIGRLTTPEEYKALTSEPKCIIVKKKRKKATKKKEIVVIDELDKTYPYKGNC